MGGLSRFCSVLGLVWGVVGGGFLWFVFFVCLFMLGFNGIVKISTHKARLCHAYKSCSVKKGGFLALSSFCCALGMLTSGRI